MTRGKPFSGKQKKQQLQERRERKRAENLWDDTGSTASTASTAVHVKKPHSKQPPAKDGEEAAKGRNRYVCMHMQIN